MSLSDLWSNFISFFCGIAMIIFAFYYLVVPYREFKLGMQNGQTRLQIWGSQLLGILTITVITWFFWILASGISNQSWQVMGGMFLGYLNGVLFSYALGSGFALLPRKWKVIVGVSIPTIFFVILVELIRLLVGIWHPSQQFIDVLVNFFSWSGTWILFEILWLAIMIGLSYIFTMHQQLRRD